MKRSLLLTALAVLFLAVSCSDSGSNQTEKKAPERKGWSEGFLYGDVESIAITYCTLTEKFGELVKDEIYIKEVYKFNPKGDVTEEETYYNSNGSLSWKKIYKYDSQGNCIEEARYNSDGSLFYKDICKYDSQGNCIEEAVYNDGSLRWKYLYKYDSQGKPIEDACYNSDGSLSRKHLYKYDSQGNRIEEVGYEGDIMKPTRMVERTIVYRK